MTWMAADMTDAPVPLGDYVPSADERVVMYGMGWSQYETLLALRGERRSPRMAYLDGAIELMSPSKPHEQITRRMEALINAHCLDRDIAFFTSGSQTLRRQLKDAGLEPDASFNFDVDRDLPDLAVEVIWTTGGLAKLEIYRRLGVAEVWFWTAAGIVVHELVDDAYVAQRRSPRLPELDLDLVDRLARSHASVNDIVRELRAAGR
jgi:Uma2 family endonuclease